MKTLILVICMGVLSFHAYSQGNGSKLANAVRISKVGGSDNRKPTTSGKKSVRVHQKRIKVTKQDLDEKYAAIGYMVISDISFGNSDFNDVMISDFGTDMYASEVKYLKPKISYLGIASKDKNITLDIKIIDENGSTERGSNSPEDYTYQQDFTVHSGSAQTMNMVGYGNRKGGAFSPGLYKYEVWYEGNMLYQKEFRLFSGSTPVVENKLLSIRDISFGSTDDSNNIIIGFGDTLLKSKIKYLRPRITYEGTSLSDQNLTFFYRIFKTEGDLWRNATTSPIGFTSKEVVTIKKGINTLLLNGWGSNNGSLYTAGQYIYQIWLDGSKLYDTTFNVKEDESSTTLTVDGKTAVSTSFDTFGGTETFYIKTNSDSWDTWGVPSWCEIKNKTATSFTLYCNSNSGTARSDYMKVKAGGEEVRIDIIQK